MKNILVACSMFIGIWMVCSRPADENYKGIEIESILDEKEGNGTIYAHLLSDGTMVRRKTYTKLVNGVEIIVQEGIYSFIGENNLVHKVFYVADEKGYRARSTISNSTGFIEDSIDQKPIIRTTF
ncbi:uncharacterized protein LOC129777674 isoform X2 [Toxorhynchites rutilus septentrionalis]|uniref:uncharacterized protein LOC129777674 isoform X2 n=1 Tax=Toxorhynchites rutilus septentrionalis TaxID=329112 RepID=UPI00247AC061|nr:uncharacterized protein LOC129777674 isoform X2 [Toxorhynchites rutilus septentrionalis]